MNRREAIVAGVSGIAAVVAGTADVNAQSATPAERPKWSRFAPCCGRTTKLLLIKI